MIPEAKVHMSLCFVVQNWRACERRTPKHPSPSPRGGFFLSQMAHNIYVAVMRDLEQEKATHSSILAWRIPWTEVPGGLQPMGLQRVRGSSVTKQQQQEITPSTKSQTRSCQIVGSHRTFLRPYHRDAFLSIN